MPGNSDAVKKEDVWLQAHFSGRNEAHGAL